jgi:ubiquitin carboxyl-terminal hydrolase 7
MHAKRLPVHAFPEDVLFDHKFQPEDVLGLDHIDKGPRRPNPAERAIVIR